MSEEVDFGELFGIPGSGKNTAKKEIKWKRQRLQVPKPDEQKTEFVCRIIPPVKSCKQTQEWFVATEEFYGYLTRSRTDKTKTVKRPFSIKGFYDKKTNPAQQKIYAVKNEMAQKVTEMSAAGASQEEIQEMQRPLNAWLKEHNKDFKFNLNVCDMNGQLFVLQITPKLKDQLVMLRDKLLEDNVDILDPNSGAWLVFTRTGTFGVPSSINDKVETLTEMKTFEGGIKAQVIKQAPISMEMAKKIAEFAPDLKTEISSSLPIDLVEKIVNGPEDPDFVDKVWAEAAARNKTPVNDKAPSDSDEFFKKNFGA